ncbi:CoA ester lyase [Pseudarthrobacter sp. NPDC080039]|uniref:HpcH/HpaI aldolase/citrate lyase family protein n=1 Tax=unclassified Pseudarthrobacter TaxID=2647000 RepID=UPI00345032E5
MTTRRSVLCVPASEPAKVAKALAVDVDEVVVDLEDAVAPTRKDDARAVLAAIAPRERGGIAVRVNALNSAWVLDDLAAVVANDAITSIVLPKVDSAEDIEEVERQLVRLEGEQGRAALVRVQALIESAHGIGDVQAIAAASRRMVSLIIGYADLGVSLGRRLHASWQFAHDAVILAARIAGIQAVDGPLLTVHADAALQQAAVAAESLGFDGKWVIHPRQAGVVQDAFTPSGEEADEARGLLAAMDAALRSGQGAVQWRGRMLDEAVAVQARRVLSRVVIS